MKSHSKIIRVAMMIVNHPLTLLKILKKRTQKKTESKLKSRRRARSHLELTRRNLKLRALKRKMMSPLKIIPEVNR